MYIVSSKFLSDQDLNDMVQLIDGFRRDSMLCRGNPHQQRGTQPTTCSASIQGQRQPLSSETVAVEKVHTSGRMQSLVWMARSMAYLAKPGVCSASILGTSLRSTQGKVISVEDIEDNARVDGDIYYHISAQSTASCSHR